MFFRQSDSQVFNYLQLNLGALCLKKYIGHTTIPESFKSLLSTSTVLCFDNYHWASLIINQIQIQSKSFNILTKESIILSELIAPGTGQILQAFAGNVKKAFELTTNHRTYTSIDLRNLVFNLDPHNRDYYEIFINGLDVFSDAELCKLMAASRATSTEASSSSSSRQPFGNTQTLSWLMFNASLTNIKIMMHSYFGSKNLNHFADVEIPTMQIEYNVYKQKSNLVLRKCSLISVKGFPLIDLPIANELLRISEIETSLHISTNKSQDFEASQSSDGLSDYDLTLDNVKIGSIFLVLHPEIIARIIRIFLFPSRMQSPQESKRRTTSRPLESKSQLQVNVPSRSIKGNFIVDNFETLFWTEDSTVAKLNATEIICTFGVKNFIDFESNFRNLKLFNVSTCSSQIILVSNNSSPINLKIGKNLEVEHQPSNYFMDVSSTAELWIHFESEFLLRILHHLNSYSFIFTYLTSHDFLEKDIESIGVGEQTADFIEAETIVPWLLKIRLQSCFILVQDKTILPHALLLLKVPEFKGDSIPENLLKFVLSLNNLEIIMCPPQPIVTSPISLFEYISNIKNSDLVPVLNNILVSLELTFPLSKKDRCLHVDSQLKKFNVSNSLELRFCNAVYAQFLNFIEDFSSCSSNQLQKLRNSSTLDFKSFESFVLLKFLKTKPLEMYFMLRIDPIVYKMFEFEFGTSFSQLRSQKESFYVRLINFCEH